MLKVDERVGASQPTLNEWASRALGLPEVRVQVRLRGNNLYLLCEGTPCPDVSFAVRGFARALAATPLETLRQPDQPRIYQIFLSGREFGHNRPDWTVRLDPHQLDRYLDQDPPPAPAEISTPAPALAIPAPSSAPALHGPDTSEPHQLQPPAATGTPEPPRSGQGKGRKRASRPQTPEAQADAIARHLSESLTPLGIAVRCSIKEFEPAPTAKPDSAQSSLAHLAQPAPQSRKRLWVVCESAYSPEPSLLEEPIVRRLRALLDTPVGEFLKEFKSASIVGRVSGEAKPEWVVRVNLTPAEELLRAWARWGDVQAIAALLNRALASQKVAVRAALQESTLHLLCSAGDRSPSPSAGAPDKHPVVAAVLPVLQSISPQGIHATTIYGVRASERHSDSQLFISAETLLAQEESPVWIHWLDLPAAKDPAKAETALELAKRGDIAALTFLLDRVIHSNLNAKLATGGIQVQVLQKGDLLHVIADASVCPQQSRVGPPVARFLRQLQLPGITGLRVYGRRAGAKLPLWRYGADFVARPNKVKAEPPKELAAPVTGSGNLLSEPGELVFRPDLKPEESDAGESPTLPEKLVEAVQLVLVRSQVFVPSNPLARQVTPQGAWVALVWGTLGLLLTLQTDWAIGALLRSRFNQVSPEAIAQKPGNVNTDMPAPTVSVPLPQIELSKSKTDDRSVFNASGFTEQGESEVTIAGNCPTTGGDIDPERCVPESSDYPSFNSRQLDGQVAIYQKYLEEVGKPDIMIVGSSRALRGVDPLTLQKTLNEQGYRGLKIFNFGINGATAQVVDLLLREILLPDQLPKLVLWADGARALNSGRVDVTYNGIALSEGYKKLAKGKRPVVTPQGVKSSDSGESAESASAGKPVAETFWRSSYQEIGEWLNEKLAGFSATYPRRDLLKALLQQQLAQTLTSKSLSLAPSPDEPASPQKEASDAETPAGNQVAVSVDSNGFLPLPVRFNPTTYYKKHPRVSGSFDADYESFQVAGRQTAAFKTVLQFLSERQIPLVFVNVPLTADYLDAARQQYEQEFREHMVRLSMEQKFIFRDLSELWPAQNEFFSDPSHLNRYGGYEVSKRLGQDPIIPWPSADGGVERRE
ncbi:hypothetical protein [Kamptonema formosum]|uniref:hypothetical protein n=1 Tax=Kamptonema formosum TaxID=331992 RepID=UPI000344C0FB|nr:hypothetical protein [Oscillatoria sp. PCC 10802]